MWLKGDKLAPPEEQVAIQTWVERVEKVTFRVSAGIDLAYGKGRCPAAGVTRALIKEMESAVEVLKARPSQCECDGCKANEAEFPKILTKRLEQCMARRDELVRAEKAAKTTMVAAAEA